MQDLIVPDGSSPVNGLKSVVVGDGGICTVLFEHFENFQPNFLTLESGGRHQWRVAVLVFSIQIDQTSVARQLLFNGRDVGVENSIVEDGADVTARRDGCLGESWDWR